MFAQTSERRCFARREADVSCWKGIPEHGVLKRREETSTVDCLVGTTGLAMTGPPPLLFLFACVRPGGVRGARGGGEDFVRGPFYLKKVKGVSPTEWPKKVSK